MRFQIAALLLISQFTAQVAAAQEKPTGKSGDGAAYTSDPGSFKIQTVRDLVLHDARRQKVLQLRIIHPEEEGPFPVVIWSHGAFGTKDNYLPLTEYWVSHGYVTVQTNHSDSRALGMKPGDPNGFRDWQSRPADISFIIDSFGEIEKKQPVLKGKLDPKRIGVGGHSFGANTAQLIGGATAFPRGGEKNFADQRVRAVVLLSGQGPGEMLTEKSWDKFTKPMLVMSGSADGPTRTGQPAVWRKKPYELSPAGNKFLVWVEGLDHGYGGLTGANFNPRLKPNEDHMKYAKVATLAFWDAYLKERTAARDYLRSDKLRTFSKDTLTLEHK